MGRRGRNEGSIYQRKDGLWVGQFKVHTVNGGKYKYIYGRVREDVAKKLTKAMADRDSGFVFDSQSLPFEKYLDKWLNAIRGTIAHGTWKQYETVVRLHIKPALGTTKLDRLNPLHIQTLYREKLDSGLSARRMVYVHVTIHKALKQAVRWSLIPRNVADAVEPPKPHKKEIRPLSEDQVRVLLETVEGDRLEALYVLAVTTGMRQGEILGLQWEDIDLEAGTLRVRRTVFAGTVSPPKTDKSRRNIKLTRRAVAALRSHQERQPKGFSEWVFHTGKGTPMSCYNLYNRSWKPLLDPPREGWSPPHPFSRSPSHGCNPAAHQRGAPQDRSGATRTLFHLDNARYLLSCPSEHAGRSRESYGLVLRGVRPEQQHQRNTKEER